MVQVGGGDVKDSDLSIFSFIHCLLIYYCVPGAVTDFWGRSVGGKKDKNLCPLKVFIQMGEDNK